jgi:hypothetical protein
LEEEVLVNHAAEFGIKAAQKILAQGGASLMQQIKSQM